MKKTRSVAIITLTLLTLTSCSTVKNEVNEAKKEAESALNSSDKKSIEIATKDDTGAGSLELIDSIITTKDNTLEFKTKDIDEDKVVFIYVANELAFEEKITNNEVYKLDITNIKEAHSTDYKPRIQLIQTKDDQEDSDIVTFKQVRYTVKK